MKLSMEYHNYYPECMVQIDEQEDIYLRGYRKVRELCRASALKEKISHHTTTETSFPQSQSFV